MYTQKIQKIEEELRLLYCEGNVNKDRKELLKGFWEHHIMPVVSLSKEMAKKYGANAELSWMGALFHDFALIDGSEPHDELGAILTQKFLSERGFDEDFCQKVSNIVLTHRCKKFMPQTLEEKIVATADAMAHFLPNFYLGIAMVAKEDYAGIFNAGVAKLERDYEEKIFFADEKKLLHERMADFRKWFEYESK
ncbi:MAG: HD domain-containing protein [Candidatus Moranbacteria bacterium]|nr:HD domain-containing protein [Candidatus Moranbacteria bacterium]